MKVHCLTSLKLIIVLTVLIGCAPETKDLKAQEPLEPGFYLNFEETQIEGMNEIIDLVGQDIELLISIVDELNAYIEMPIPVFINFTDCGVQNAMYLKETNEIYICHEFIALMYQINASMGLEGEELALAVANNTFAIMYHEIGHALVDILDLPITGREEDAVDQFSVVSLLVFEELGNQALINFASFWGRLSELTETDLAQLSFYDEHSLSAQRFYDILCLAYGADPESLEGLVTEGILPENRAGRCPDDFARVENAWYSLLEPYVKE